MPHKGHRRTVRSAARALIVEDGRLLVIKMKRPGAGTFHVLPGGGQQHGETLVEGLLRECEEEIGFRPAVGRIAYVREYIGRHHLFAEAHRAFHQLEVVFHCTLPSEPYSLKGHAEDRHQVGIGWLPLAEMRQKNFSPSLLANFVDGAEINISEAYLGDIN
jgi:8-oxo-dGTP pyrophosphatase MutT (NUDIX family)